MTIAPVVAAVDGSEESLRAVEWAALEACRHRAPLRIVSAPAPARGSAGHAPYRPVARAASRRLASRALSDAVVRAGELVPDLLIATDLLPVGPPALAVAASGSGALMLVVGARGAGDFTAMLLGSVSRYAAMHASCPVVVVREESDAVHREVVVGIGDPDEAAEALDFAFDEAARRAATLVVAHAWRWQPGGLDDAMHGDMPGPGDPARTAAEIGGSLAEALEIWQHKYPDVPVRPDVVRAHPARLLASYSLRADLVVIGRHGHPGGRVIGGVQHALLQHARGPVAVVPCAGSLSTGSLHAGDPIVTNENPREERFR